MIPGALGAKNIQVFCPNSKKRIYDGPGPIGDHIACTECYLVRHHSHECLIEQNVDFVRNLRIGLLVSSLFLALGPALYFGLQAYKDSKQSSRKVTPGSPSIPDIPNLKEQLQPSNLHTRNKPAVPQTFISKQELHTRIEAALYNTKDRDVVYEDILGEGQGQWDSDPVYPNNQVNCIVWLREIVAEVYGQDAEERQRTMDRLRYYGDRRSFATRKHFGTRWLSMDPGPFQILELNDCGEKTKRPIELDLVHFASSQSYSCPLYRMSESKFEIEYLKPSTTLDCAKKMEPGFYFLFAVASREYNRIFGKKSGPMGLVHGMVLELSDIDRRSANRSPRQMKIHHASISTKRVETENLGEFISRMKGRRHDGYVVTKLNPTWNSVAGLDKHKGPEALFSCEASLGTRKPSSHF